MRAVQRPFSSITLVAFVALADALLLFAVLPFEVYCLTVLGNSHAAMPFLIFALFVNACAVALMAAAVAATGELLRRGVTRRVRLRLPSFVRGRSKPFGY